MKYGLVKYSSSPSSERLKNAKNVYQVNLKVFFNDEPTKYYTDLQELFKVEKTKKDLAKTSQPSTMDILETIKNALTNHEFVFVLTPEKMMSGTHQNTVLAVDMLEENEKKRIKIIEVRSFGIAETVFNEMILDLFEKDLSVKEISGAIESRVMKFTYYAGVEKLEYLANGGRFDLSKVIIGKLLRTRVIVKQKDTERTLHAKCKGAKGVIKEIETLISGENVKAFYYLSINTDIKYKEVFVELCNKYDKQFIDVADASTVVGAQLGNGSFLVGVEEY